MDIRKCSRALIVNEFNEILLEEFEFKDVIENKVLWVTPGGGINLNETPVEALKRELDEELGIIIDIKDMPIFELDVLIEGKKGSFISREIYYKIKIQSNTKLSIQKMSENEKNTFRGLKWWSKKELQEMEEFAPRDILNYF
ncbi:NUDIX domain-containing protein [Bacillus sp. V33-4]|uniref:NUDIX domain-containing protein n=1 Tax=Bacillus sp. V33-4 TaxID=2054169 RepID=UPI000C775F0E|nr:NUDIX hydrolase [Bacillus sp. V33-4]PLR84821.1 DNA mismatch repair protein MutT [Bacillus sp. V33-4]